MTWCAPELTTLPDDVCYHAAPSPAATRKGDENDPGDRSPGPAAAPSGDLVIFLHGLVLQTETWQYAQQRAAVRGARRGGFSVLMPKGKAREVRGKPMVAWPTGVSAQRDHEAKLLAQWARARALVEVRRGRTFERTFVVGFSNGAYYASSLAMRDRIDAQGYAVFAGGSDYRIQVKERERRDPIFIGVCLKDSTRKDARKLARSLGRAHWPFRLRSRRVGHLMSDAHLDDAIAWLRTQSSGARRSAR